MAYWSGYAGITPWTETMKFWYPEAAHFVAEEWDPLVSLRSVQCLWEEGLEVVRGHRHGSLGVSMSPVTLEGSHELRELIHCDVILHLEHTLPWQPTHTHTHTHTHRNHHNDCTVSIIILYRGFVLIKNCKNYVAMGRIKQSHEMYIKWRPATSRWIISVYLLSSSECCRMSPSPSSSWVAWAWGHRISHFLKVLSFFWS